MKIIDVCIQDLKTIQSAYPNNSRGYEALRLAIEILNQRSEEVGPHWVLGEKGISHAGQR